MTTFPINNIILAEGSPFLQISWMEWKLLIKKYGINKVNKVISAMESELV